MLYHIQERTFGYMLNLRVIDGKFCGEQNVHKVAGFDQNFQENIYIVNVFEEQNVFYDYCKIQGEVFWLASNYPVSSESQILHFSKLYFEIMKDETVCINQVDRQKDALVLARMRLIEGSNLPKLFTSLDKRFLHFPKSISPIGLYPIVPSYAWLEKISDSEVKMVQLRIKNHENLEKNIKLSVSLATRHNIKLFINDHWELAIKHGAYGIHLGQGDLHTANLKKIADAKIRLGISTHCYHELARAKALNPSYLAIGAIFKTHTKIMDFKPQGVERLKLWIDLSDVPVVAIGGINISNILQVSFVKPSGIAVISAILNADNPTIMAAELLRVIKQ